MKNKIDDGDEGYSHPKLLLVVIAVLVASTLIGVAIAIPYLLTSNILHITTQAPNGLLTLSANVPDNGTNLVGESLTFTATLTGSNIPISGVTITFYRNTTSLGTALTNAGGIASYGPYLPPEGSWDYKAQITSLP